jgi:hypothetical protein
MEVPKAKACVLVWEVKRRQLWGDCALDVGLLDRF